MLFRLAKRSAMPGGIPSARFKGCCWCGAGCASSPYLSYICFINESGGCPSSWSWPKSSKTFSLLLMSLLISSLSKRLQISVTLSNWLLYLSRSSSDRSCQLSSSHCGYSSFRFFIGLYKLSLLIISVTTESRAPLKVSSSWPDSDKNVENYLNMSFIFYSLGPPSAPWLPGAPPSIWLNMFIISGLLNGFSSSFPSPFAIPYKSAANGSACGPLPEFDALFCYWAWDYSCWVAKFSKFLNIAFGSSSVITGSSVFLSSLTSTLGGATFGLIYSVVLSSFFSSSVFYCFWYSAVSLWIESRHSLKSFCASSTCFGSTSVS